MTSPLMAALALNCLMLTAPILAAALAPSTPPIASPTAPDALAVSDPVTLSLPVRGVDSDSTSCAPLARIGPRTAVQPISAFCSTCDTGLSDLPAKSRGAARSAVSRMAESATATGATTIELRGAATSGGSSESTGGEVVGRGAIQSIALRLAKKETATTAIASRIVLSRAGRCIIPPA